MAQHHHLLQHCPKRGSRRDYPCSPHHTAPLFPGALGRLSQGSCPSITLLGRAVFRTRHTVLHTTVPWCCCPAHSPSSRASPPAPIRQAVPRAELLSHHPQGLGSGAQSLLLSGLTLREAWWVVVDISDHDGDCGGSGQATQLSGHVCCTDHHLVPVLRLTVQVSHSCPDHTWKLAGQHECRHITEKALLEDYLVQALCQSRAS